MPKPEVHYININIASGAINDTCIVAHKLQLQGIRHALHLHFMQLKKIRNEPIVICGAQIVEVCR
jgi:hypothetical protein